MIWNWLQSDWPNFIWDAARLRRAEEQFLCGSGRLEGTIRQLGAGDREQLRIESNSSEALTTSEIEGEILNRASAQSSIRRQPGGTERPVSLILPSVCLERITKD